MSMGTVMGSRMNGADGRWVDKLDRLGNIEYRTLIVIDRLGKDHRPSPRTDV